MSLSELVLLLWVLAVSAFVKGWNITWLGWAVFVLGIAFVVLRLLELLGVIHGGPVLVRRQNPNQPPAV